MGCSLFGFLGGVWCQFAAIRCALRGGIAGGASGAAVRRISCLLLWPRCCLVLLCGSPGLALCGGEIDTYIPEVVQTGGIIGLILHRRLIMLYYFT